MKLTGELKTQVESATTREEKREAIKKAGMLLSEDEMEKVTGGIQNEPFILCPYCRMPTVNGYCENLACFYYDTPVV